MRKGAFIILFLANAMASNAQTVLTLDSCRALALRNNKQVNISRLKQDIALNTKKAMRTKYLPKVDAIGGYELMSREVSLLSKSQKDKLNNLGTLGAQQFGPALTQGLSNQITEFVKHGILTLDQAKQIGAMMQQGGLTSFMQNMESSGNTIGKDIVNGFRTDTRNMFGGAIMVRQPIFMGGAINAANRMAEIAEQMATNEFSRETQSTLYDIDQAYWTVISLKQKHELATSYRNLVKKLDDNVKKMIEQGVATRADGLKVDVKVNEADMKILQVENGLSLAKMLLCQICGLPLDQPVTLADEQSGQMTGTIGPDLTFVPDSTISSRPEIRLLQNSIDLSEQATKLIRAEYLPHVALTGGYMVSNPNTFDGFQKKFAGVWNVGIMVHVPVWNWSEGAYKVRASKSATKIAQMELADAQQKINLQINQCRFKLSEAQKRLVIAEKNTQSAKENLRCAEIGFKEGVIGSTDVMAAQTAWQEAQSQKIDAEVDVRLSRVNLEKALGIINQNN